MRSVLLVLTYFSGMSLFGQVYRFGEPQGVAMWSRENHKPSPDGFSGVRPVVIVEGKIMTVIWGDAKSGGGQDIAWKAAIVLHDSRSITAICVDSGEYGSATMLYTLDLKRGFLYMSAHKNSEILGGSAANSYVAKLEKK